MEREKIMEKDIHEVIAEAQRLRGAHLRHLVVSGIDHLTHAMGAIGHKLSNLVHHKGATA